MCDDNLLILSRIFSKSKLKGVDKKLIKCWWKVSEKLIKVVLKFNDWKKHCGQIMKSGWKLMKCW